MVRRHVPHATRRERAVTAQSIGEMVGVVASGKSSSRRNSISARRSREMASCLPRQASRVRLYQ